MRRRGRCRSGGPAPERFVGDPEGRGRPGGLSGPAGGPGGQPQPGTRVGIGGFGYRASGLPVRGSIAPGVGCPHQTGSTPLEAIATIRRVQPVEHQVRMVIETGAARHDLRPLRHFLRLRVMGISAPARLGPVCPKPDPRRLIRAGPPSGYALRGKIKRLVTHTGSLPYRLAARSLGQRRSAAPTARNANSPDWPPRTVSWISGSTVPPERSWHMPLASSVPLAPKLGMPTFGYKHANVGQHLDGAVQERTSPQPDDHRRSASQSDGNGRNRHIRPSTPTRCHAAPTGRSRLRGSRDRLTGPPRPVRQIRPPTMASAWAIASGREWVPGSPLGTRPRETTLARWGAELGPHHGCPGLGAAALYPRPMHRDPRLRSELRNRSAVRSPRQTSRDSTLAAQAHL